MGRREDCRSFVDGFKSRTWRYLLIRYTGKGYFLFWCTLTSILTKYTREVLAPVVAASKSYSDLLRNLGLSINSGSLHNYLKEKVLEYHLDTSHFLGTAWAKGCSKKSKRSPDSILIVLTSGRRIKSDLLRRALIESGVTFLCDKCVIGPEWDGEPLNLEVDHINGDWRDCRRGNLHFLCPNCHSQKGVTKVAVCSCGKHLSTKGTKRCKDCHVQYIQQFQHRFQSGVQPTHKTKITWPSELELRTLVLSKPVSSIALDLGVSGNAIKKRCKRLGIILPTRGYWQKLQAQRQSTYSPSVV